MKSPAHQKQLIESESFSLSVVRSHHLTASYSHFIYSTHSTPLFKNSSSRHFITIHSSFSLLLFYLSLFRKLCMLFSSHSSSIYCLLYSLSSTLAHFNNLFSSLHFSPFTPTFYPSLSLSLSHHLADYSLSNSFCLPGRLTEREIG